MTESAPPATASPATTFADLNLLPELLRAVQEQGYTSPSPIQAQAIPPVLARRDIMGCAQTGTGKTASFTLPMLQLLAPHASTSPSPARHPVRALVLTPTRELAMQVEQSVKTYGKYLPLRATCLYGGVDIKPQIKVMQGGVEIVVATPGRLLDHLEGKSISLGAVQILILDEADRMLDMGFMPAITRILAALPAMRQNLLFSATFSDEIKKLASGFMRGPLMIEVARRNAPAELVTHQAYEIDAAKKHALLKHVLTSREIPQALIFVRMKRDADRLARQLKRDGFSANAIHGDRTQSERTIALDEFKNGTAKFLVATDVAARGIDIDQLPFVINYELPNTAEDYVHRIGRTGRAGTPGEAISLVSADETEYLVAIEKLLKRQIPRLEAPSLDREREHRREGSHGKPRQDEHRRERGEQAGRGERGDRGDRAERYHRDEKDINRPRPRRGLSDAPPASPAPQYPHFDFSKPYEPAAKKPAELATVEGAAEPASTTTAAATRTPLAPRRGAAKPVAALFRRTQTKSG
jgi:ATP-dependent RNA helicase RhlE